MNTFALKALVSNPPNSIRDGGVIAEGFNQELDELRILSQDDSKFNDFEQQEIINASLNIVALIKYTAILLKFPVTS